MLPRKVENWQDYFMGLVFKVAERSKDPTTQHGSLIADDKNRILSTGYNGGSRRIPDELVDWERPNKYAWVIHSEENALWMAKSENLENCTFYVTGPPCSRCMLRISHAGIQKVVYGSRGSNCVHNADWSLGQKIAELSKIELIEYKSETF